MPTFYLNDCENLGSTPWACLEFSDVSADDRGLRRLLKRIPKIFGNDPIELFDSIPYLYVRSTNVKALLKLQRIEGFQGLVTVGDTNNVSDVIWIDNQEVQQLIADERNETIKEGDTVVPIYGHLAGLPGVVRRIDNAIATLRMAISSKSLWLRTPISNLTKGNV